MKHAIYLSLILFLASGPFGEFAAADTFGSGANAFHIRFVMIGSPGNPSDSDPNRSGAVPYRYRIGTYEVSEELIDKANALGGLGITKDMRSPDQPATSVTWYEAARFVNWLNTLTGYVPAYKFDLNGDFQLWDLTDPGYDADNLYRNKRAKYFLPSIDEWHKAAYYDRVAGIYYNYPTGSDIIPDGIDVVGDAIFEAVFYDGAFNSDPNDIMNVGLSSPYGTAGQGGNVAEWVETAFDRVNDSAGEHRSAPGGSWGSTHAGLAAWNTGIGDSPSFPFNFIGVRVASVIPEPRSMSLLIFATVASLGLRIRVSHIGRCCNAKHRKTLGVVP